MSENVHYPVVHRNSGLTRVIAGDIVRTTRYRNFNFGSHSIITVARSVITHTRNGCTSISTVTGSVGSGFNSGAINIVFPVLSHGHFTVYLHNVTHNYGGVILVLDCPSSRINGTLLA